MKTHLGIMTANGFRSKQNFAGDSDWKVRPGSCFPAVARMGLLLLNVAYPAAIFGMAEAVEDGPFEVADFDRLTQ
jgi:hypothetical protein